MRHVQTESHQGALRLIMAITPPIVPLLLLGRDHNVFKIWVRAHSVCAAFSRVILGPVSPIESNAEPVSARATFHGTATRRSPGYPVNPTQALPRRTVFRGNLPLFPRRRRHVLSFGRPVNLLPKFTRLHLPELLLVITQTLHIL